jgi:hypothetical protein
MNLKPIILAAAVAMVGVGYADLTVVQKVTSPAPGGGAPRQSTVTQRVKGTKMRMDMDQMTSSLIDLDAGKMYMLDHGGKKAVAMPLDMMKKQAEQMQAALAGGQKPGASTVTPTGKTQTIGGLACKEYKVSASGSLNMTATYWMAEDAKVTELEPFKKFIGDMNPMLGKDVFSQLKGLPMRSESTLQVGGQAIVSTSEVTSLSHDPVADDVFVIPAGYALETLELGGLGR